MARKPAAATKSPAKKPATITVRAKVSPAPVARGKTPAPVAKAKTPATVVTLKHIAAEIAEAHELPKTHAETMLADTVDRLAKHLVKGNKVRIVGLGIFQVKEARSANGPQSADRGSGEDQGQQEGHLPRRQGIEGNGVADWGRFNASVAANTCS